MLEFMLVLIAVIFAIVAIIVNRKSLLACVVITGVAAVLSFGFLLLYANTHRMGSYSNLVTVTVLLSSALIIILVVVTYIGVKMHYKKNSLLSKFKKPAPVAEKPITIDASSSMPSGTTVTTPTFGRAGTRPTPVGIFGRQPIEKTKPSETVVEPAPSVTPVVHPAPAAPTVAAPKPADDMMQRMLKKAEQFMAAKQFMLAEQMYTTYIQRCADASQKADGQLFVLVCSIEAQDKERATSQLNELIAKMRSGEYALDGDQKRKLAECKMRIMAM